MKGVYTVLGLCLITASAYASDPGLEEVQQLGTLNGRALACEQMENVSHIKQVMVSLAPKTRSYGAAFEQHTNEAFLQRSNELHACDDAPLTALQVDSLATRLQALFPPRQ